MNVALVATITCIVLCAAITDACTGLIPDRISLGGFAIVTIIAAFGGLLQASLLGAASAGGALGLLYMITRGRGLGFGDVKLALAMGAALGPVVGMIALGLAFIFGAMIATALLLLRRIERGHEMYFAPYLAAGTLAATFGHVERFL